MASKGCTLEERCAETPEFSHVIRVGTCRLATREGKSWKGPQVIWANVGQHISPAEGCTVDFRLGGHVVSGHLCHPASVLKSSQTEPKAQGLAVLHNFVSGSQCVRLLTPQSNVVILKQADVRISWKTSWAPPRLLTQ